MSKAIIDKYNFVPCGMKEESQEGFILFDSYINEKAVKEAAKHGIHPSFVGKAIGKWDISRFSFDLIATQCVIMIGNMVKGMSKVWHVKEKHSDEFAKTNLSVFNNIDFKGIIKSTMGYDVADPKEWMNAIQAEYEEASKTADPKKLSEFSAKCVKLIAFTQAMTEHDPAFRKKVSDEKRFKFKAGQLNTQPTNDDVMATMESVSLENTKFFGDMTFFGWDGKPESLESINPESAQLDGDSSVEIINSPTCPVISTHVGYNENHPKGFTPTPVCMLSVFDDPSHRNWREMNWYLNENEFAKYPYSSGKKLEDILYSTQKDGSGNIWIGKENEADYLRKEGLFMEVRSAGAVLLSQCFYEFSERISDATLVPDEKQAAGMAAFVWSESLTRLAASNISRYGLTSAAIIEQLCIGYFVTPFFYELDDSEIETGFANKEGIEKMIEANIGGDRAGEIINIQPVYKKSWIEKIGEKGEWYEAFIKELSISIFPYFSKEEVEAEVNKAVVKLATVYERAASSQIFSDSLKGDYEMIGQKDAKLEVKEREVSKGDFAKMMDDFCEERTHDGKAIIFKKLEELEKLNLPKFSY